MLSRPLFCHLKLSIISGKCHLLRQEANPTGMLVTYTLYSKLIINNFCNPQFLLLLGYLNSKITVHTCSDIMYISIRLAMCFSDSGLDECSLSSLELVIGSAMYSVMPWEYLYFGQITFLILRVNYQVSYLIFEIAAIKLTILKTFHLPNGHEQ